MLTPNKVHIGSLLVRLAGAVLIAAAGMKFYGLNFSSLPSIGWMSNPAVQATVMAWEAIVGIFLLIKCTDIISYLMAIVTFGFFLIASGYLVIIGVSSCGCFGPVKTPPSILFFFDSVFLLGLLVFNPGCKEIKGGVDRAFKSFLPILLGGLALFLILFLAMVVYSGSTAGAMALITSRYVVSEGALDFGDITAGTEFIREMTVKNFHNHSIKLIGGTSDCSCATASDIPMTIGPNSSGAIRIRLKISNGTPGYFSRTAVIWTDCQGQEEIKFRLNGRIVQPSKDD